MAAAEPSAHLTIPLLGDLSAEDAAVIRPLLRRRTVSAGATVFQRGDLADAVYLVVSGQLRISVTSVDGRDLAFRVVEAGDMVGELGALDGCRRSANLTALRPSVLMALSRDTIRNLLASRPSIANGIIQFLCRRLRETSEQLETLALQRIETRLARLLLRRIDTSAVRNGECELTLDLSQSEIAALIGASRPKVSIGFHFLEKNHAIHRIGRNIICNVSAWIKIDELFYF